MKRGSLAQTILTWACFALLVAMLGAIILKFITQNLFVERLHMDNAFTRMMCISPTNTEETTNIPINWEELYPHKQLDSDDEEDAGQKDSTVDAFEKQVQSIEEKISSYATQQLPWYEEITEIANRYEGFIGWNITPYGEYNGVTTLENGYLVEFVEKQDTAESAQSTISLAHYCQEQGADFLYVEYPSKISKYEDTDLSGVLDFSNQNADDFLAVLEDAGIEVLDIRENIRQEGLSHRELFYNTDHHWKAETGLWAAGIILQELHARFGIDIHDTTLEESDFDRKVYPEWFLGSQGKKITLARAKPEDIALIYPQKETSFHYEIPNLGIDTVGDFSVTYDMSHIDECDYYNKNPYAAYNHADQALIQIENQLMEDNGKVLIIHTSFSNCVIPFLALCVKNIDALDLRTFTGSVKSYIEQTKPDIVMVASTCGQEGSVVKDGIWDFE